TEVSASTSGFGAGTATTGPTRSVRYNGLPTACPRRDGRGQRDPDRPADLGRQFVRIGRAIGVADRPVQDRIAEGPGRQVVQAIRVADGVFLGRGIDLRLGDDSSLQVRDRLVVGAGEGEDRGTVVTAAGIRRATRARGRLD